MAREAAARQPLCIDIDGFSLHAAVRVEAHDRKRLEQLCRYITRPALSDERVQLNAAGQVELKLKSPWRDGTTHLVMSPLEFMQRLAALVPRPRLHLIRFHGWLAPNAKLRSLVVPRRPPAHQEPATKAAAAAQGPGARPEAALRCLSRVRRPMPIATGCAATLQPGWRRALCRQAMANTWVNPKTRSDPASRERPKTFQPGSREPQTPGFSAESAQTRVLQPSAGQAYRLLRPILGPSDGVCISYAPSSWTIRKWWPRGFQQE